MTELFYIGIDGGGTKCRARLENAEGTLLGEGISGPANIMRNCTVAISSIKAAIDIAIKQSSMSIDLGQCVVGAGLAGANISLAAEQFHRWSHPFHAVYLLSDLHAACLGAHKGNEGAAIIIGTGSAGARWENDQFRDIGGHGFPIGDIASGAWLGLKAIQQTLLVMDELAPQSPLSQAVCNALDVHTAEALVAACACFNTHHYAALVEAMLPLYDNNDCQTLEIFREGAGYIDSVATRLLANNTLPLAMIGGLSDIYSSHLSAAVKSRLVPCAETPQQGALHFAKHAFSKTVGIQ